MPQTKPFDREKILGLNYVSLYFVEFKEAVEFYSEVLGKPVSEIMTRKLVVCAPEDDMVHVMACMTQVSTSISIISCMRCG